jgi:adenosine deaminase
MALLLYCDTIQEWGRSKAYETETSLVDIRITDNNVHCEVAFDRNDTVKKKLDEINDVMRCIRSSGEIDFTFSPRVHVST